MNQPSQHVAADSAAFLPLFCRAPVLLSSKPHTRSGQSRRVGFDFALEASGVPLGIAEFMPAIPFYPIVFSLTGPATPLAVLGLRQGSKFSPDEETRCPPGHYQPGYLRRYPFKASVPSEQHARLFTVVPDADRLALTLPERKGARRLFDAAGAEFPAARSSMDLCQAFHEDHLQTAAFAEALDVAGLLMLNRCELQLADGRHYALDGFRVVDEKALRQLAPPTISEWHGKGWLDLITLHLASQRNWQQLLDLHALRQQKPRNAF
jgi:hypothetical protein